jgi:hypothetical protein
MQRGKNNKPWFKDQPSVVIFLEEAHGQTKSMAFSPYLLNQSIINLKIIYCKARQLKPVAH